MQAAVRSVGSEHAMVIEIRRYREPDAIDVGRLIADVFRRFNISYASPAQQGKLLGPFRHAHSDDLEHQRAIAQVIHAPLVLVAEAEEKGRIVGFCEAAPGGSTAFSCTTRTTDTGSGGGSWAPLRPSFVPPAVRRSRCSLPCMPSRSINDSATSVPRASDRAHASTVPVSGTSR